MRFNAVILSAALFTFSLEAQTISGSVAANDTGSPLTSATVVAVRKGIPLSQPPSIYKAAVDSTGRFSIPVATGQYQLCIHGADSYVDPCLWGGAAVVNVASTTAASAPLRPVKGRLFVVRIHDPGAYLTHSGALPSSDISVSVSTAGIKQLPLPLVYDNGRIRDYGMIVPIGIPLNVMVSSATMRLADETGTAPSAQGLSLQVTAAAPPLSSSSAYASALKFPPPTAKMLHFTVTGRK